MKRALVACAAVLLVAGCAAGSSSADRATTARETLRQDVHRLTALAANRQYVPARGWLDQVQQDVMYARSSGAIGLAREERIAAFLARVRSDLAVQIEALSETSSSPSSSAPSSTPSRAASSPLPARATHPRPTRSSRRPPPKHRRSVAPHRRRVHHHHKHRHHHHRHHGG